jgi:hypothetical protein
VPVATLKDYREDQGQGKVISQKKSRRASPAFLFKIQLKEFPYEQCNTYRTELPLAQPTNDMCTAVYRIE